VINSTKNENVLFDLSIVAAIDLMHPNSGSAATMFGESQKTPDPPARSPQAAKSLFHWQVF
jgi:hypothetical protein